MTLDDIWIAWSRPDVLWIVGLGLISMLLWQVPIVNLLFIPFQMLNTFIHELCHVIAVRVTGGQFRRFHVYLLAGGVTPVLHGRNCLVLSAGYLGAAVFGGLMILLTSGSLPSRTVLLGLGVLLGVLTFLFVGNFVGAVASLALAAALYWAGAYLEETEASAVLLFLATQVSLASFRSLLILVQIARSGRPHQSDAEIMQEMTAIPAVIWALLWCLAAVAILVWSVTVAYR